EGLVAVQDVLQTAGGGVLAGHDDLAVDAQVLQVRDDRVGHAVVRHHDGVDAVVGVVHGGEGGAGGGVVPVRDGLLGRLLPGAAGDQRVQHRHVALVEQGRVVVGRGAVEDRDVRLGDVGGL